jgi:1-hydroxy-2-naphthoate dioxygenase
MSVETHKTIEAFDGEIAALHLRGQWHAEKVLEGAKGGPRPAGAAHVWRWAELYPRLIEACEVLAEDRTARRQLGFVNPGLGQPGVTHTIAMGPQIIRPGETAWAHRHTISALRFVIQGGAGVHTVVDGEVCPMEDYDLILTPSWTWHDHQNGMDRPAIWLDALDAPLARALNTMFYETFGESCQPVRGSRSESLQERAAGLVRPVWERPTVDRLPLRYPWREVEPRLLALADAPGSPYDGVVLEYVHPVTGGSCLPTLSCWIQLLRPGEATRPHRHTSSSAYFVVRGEGETEVGETRLSWSRHDAFAVPNWAMHRHVNRSEKEPAILFSVHDLPVMRALGFYREEPEISIGTALPPAVPADAARKP